MSQRPPGSFTQAMAPVLPTSSTVTAEPWPAAPGQTFLRTLGIEIVFGREGRLGTRTIRITAMGENRTHDTVSTVSHASAHGDRAGLNHPPPGLEQAL